MRVCKETRYRCDRPHRRPDAYMTENRNAFRRHLTLHHSCDLKLYSDEVEVLHGERLQQHLLMCRRVQRHCWRRDKAHLSAVTTSPTTLTPLFLVPPDAARACAVAAVSAAQINFDAYQSTDTSNFASVAAASSATSVTSNLFQGITAYSATFPVGIEGSDDDDESLWGYQPSTMSNISNRPWNSPLRLVRCILNNGVVDLSYDMCCKNTGTPLTDELHRSKEDLYTEKSPNTIMCNKLLKTDKDVKWYTGVPDTDTWNLLRDYIRDKVTALAFTQTALTLRQSKSQQFPMSNHLQQPFRKLQKQLYNYIATRQNNSVKVQP